MVNDGSDESHMWPFEKVGAYKECTILTHDVNRGKGRALKQHLNTVSATEKITMA